jgi:hypothetical protein
MKPNLLLILAPALVAALAGCDVDDWDSSKRITEDFHHAHALKPGGRLTVESFNGSVEIFGWDKDQVEINGTKYASRKELVDAIRIDIVPSSDSLQVRAIRPSGDGRRGGNMGARFRINVPRKTRIERVDTSNGALRIESVEGDARLKTSNGAVRLYRYTGNIEVDTSNGSIELDDFSGGARLDTSNGGVTARGVRGFLEVITSNGPIEASVERLEANRPLRLKTSNGPLWLEVDDLNGNDVIGQSSNGPITLRLPPQTSARLKAGTSNSTVSTELNLTGSVTQSKTRLEGTIGSGGPLIDLSTSNGPIKVIRN